MWKVPKVPKVPKVRVLKLTCQVKHAMWKSGEKKREKYRGKPPSSSRVLKTSAENLGAENEYESGRQHGGDWRDTGQWKRGTGPKEAGPRESDEMKRNIAKIIADALTSDIGIQGRHPSCGRNGNLLQISASFTRLIRADSSWCDGGSMQVTKDGWSDWRPTNAGWCVIAHAERRVWGVYVWLCVRVCVCERLLNVYRSTENGEARSNDCRRLKRACYAILAQLRCGAVWCGATTAANPQLRGL